MVRSVVVKDGLGQVEPVLKVGLVLRLWVLESTLFVLPVDGLDLFLRTALFFSLFSLEESFRNNGCAVRDPGNLSSQVVLLLAEEEGVGDDVAFEVACEEDLDLPGCGDVFRSEVWELSPLAQGHP